MTVTSNTRPAGADWIRQALKVEPSPLGATVADLLGVVYGGIYNAPINHRKVAWTDPEWIEVAAYGSLDTYDGNRLTKLVLLAHALCVRVEVNPCNMRYLKLCFSPRLRDGGTWKRHPTIDQAVAEFRRYYGWTEAPVEQAQEVLG